MSLKAKKFFYWLTDPIVNNYGSFIGLILLQSIIGIFYVCSDYYSYPITAGERITCSFEILLFSYIISYAILLIHSKLHTGGGIFTIYF
jgi:hypothetical protein